LLALFLFRSGNMMAWHACWLGETHTNHGHKFDPPRYSWCWWVQVGRWV
jgi:hypothetical protein